MQEALPSGNVTCRGGERMALLPCMKDAWLFIEDDGIAGVGPMSLSPYTEQVPVGTQIIDASGCVVFPSFCDCHTHLVYAGSREREFMDKIRGLSYEEIAARGGGILNSAQLLQSVSENKLFEETLPRVRELIGFGTGAVEIKSGYGLTLRDELKMLRVIRRIAEETPLRVKSTFLGAHAVPAEYKDRKEAYVELIIREMIPAVASEKLADYIDVFCERGFFSVDDTRRIFDAGLRYGLRPRVHANQMAFSGGVQTGIEYGAVSVDHLEYLDQDGIQALAHRGVVATLLPTAFYFLKETKLPPIAALRKAGVPMAVSSDINPGTAPIVSLRMAMKMACTLFGLTPVEAMAGVTRHAARALGEQERLGQLKVGMLADFLVWNCGHPAELSYLIGVDQLVSRVVNGEETLHG